MATAPKPNEIGNGEERKELRSQGATTQPPPQRADGETPRAADYQSKNFHQHKSFPCRGPIKDQGNCCCKRSTFQCDGCGQFVAGKETWYTCKECDYKVCEACFHLGPAEGGVIRTATVNGFHGDIEPGDKFSCSDTLGARLSTTASQKEVAVSGKKSREKSESSLGQFPIVEAPDNAVVKATSSAKVDASRKKKDNNNNQGSGSSARIAYAGQKFGLAQDSNAEALWKQFVSTATRSTPDGEKILNVARQSAQYFNFLELTVKSHIELEREQYTRAKDKCLELYSPFAGVDLSIKEELIKTALRVVEANRSIGSLVGMAVGDSIGAPFEFLEAVDEEGSHRYDLKTLSRKNVKNKFKVKPGQWTDDSSMGLCLADTLLTKGVYDGSDVRIRYHNWWFRGYNNAFGNDTRIGSVGLGGNVAQSLRAMASNQKPTPTYEAVTQDAGNGTIMRLSPVPVFFYRNPEEAAMVSADSSYATHPGPIAAAACAFQGYLIASAIGRKPESPNDAAGFLEHVVESFLKAKMPGAGNCKELERLLRSEEPSGGKEECWNWKAPKLRIQSTLRARGLKYNGYPCTPDYFGSYCIDGMAVALWSFYHTKSYAEAVVRCTNFLGDADTTSAICGQIAGAFYGYDAILPEWLKDLQKWDDLDIATRGALLWALQESQNTKS